MDKDIQSFKEKLEAVSEWPSLYMFKFIVKAEQEQLVQDIFHMHEVISKPSKNGNYISLTINIMAGSADQIIEKYIETSKIKGIIAL
ncbi:MAG: putative lipoic acid-binding regulatory protein [Marivirga sp.]|jgi:putative lipoic acid-binding regulatory protein